MEVGAADARASNPDQHLTAGDHRLWDVHEVEPGLCCPRELLQAIYRQSMRAHAMIADMMTYAKPPLPKRAEVDLISLAKTAIAEAEEAARRTEDDADASCAGRAGDGECGWQSRAARAAGAD